MMFAVHYRPELSLPLAFPINWRRRGGSEGDEREGRVGRRRVELAGMGRDGNGGPPVQNLSLAKFTVIDPTARLFLHSRSSTESPKIAVRRSNDRIGRAAVPISAVAPEAIIGAGQTLSAYVQRSGDRRAEVFHSGDSIIPLLCYGTGSPDRPRRMTSTLNSFMDILLTTTNCSAAIEKNTVVEGGGDRRFST